MATTNGFVQKLNWLSGGPTACIWVGSAPNSAEIFTVQVAAGDSAATIRFKQALVGLLVTAQLTGREVSVGHDDGSATITSVGTTVGDVAATPVQVDAIEVTQAIQDLAHSIPLFVGKRTVVRVYLSYYDAPGITVRGEISIRRGPADAPLTVASENIVFLNPAHAGDLSAKRDDANSSLNFVLPDTHIAEGPLSVQIASITNTVTNTAVSCGFETRPTVYFQDTAPLRVRVLGMRYTQGGVTHTPSNLDFDLVESWLRRAYPTGQVNMSTGIVDATAAVPFRCGSINAQIAAIRAQDVANGTDARTHYFGLVSDGGFFMQGCAAGIPATAQPQTVASGPTGSGNWGWDFDGSYGDWYTGHELGHTYGRQHPGFCGETESDLDNYPFQGGQLANMDDSFAGFDVGDPANGLAMVALPGTQWHDVMTYCDFEWLSAYTYLGIRRRLADENALAAGPVPSVPGPSGSGGRPDERNPHRKPSPKLEMDVGDADIQGLAAQDFLISVVATVNLTKKEGKIQYVNPVDWAMQSGAVKEGLATLRVKGSAGDVLNEYSAEVKLNSDPAPGDDETGIVDEVITVDAGATTIELLIGGVLADSVQVGGGTSVMVAPATVSPGVDTLGIYAAVDDAGADNQTYSVQVSTDDGQSWQTLAIGLTEPSYTIDRTQFSEGQQVQVRIIATDGLTRDVVATEFIRV